MPGIILLAIWWGVSIEELLTLQVVGKSGIAMGVMYGCVIGTGISCIVSAVRANK